MIKLESLIEITEKEEPHEQERTKLKMKSSSLDGPYQRSAEAPPRQRAGARVLGCFGKYRRETLMRLYQGWVIKF